MFRDKNVKAAAAYLSNADADIRAVFKDVAKEADVIAEQFIQQIKSSDDLSDADVKAIREEIINNKKLLREKLLADITTTNLARWGMDIGRSENTPKMSIDEAVKKVKDSFFGYKESPPHKRWTRFY